MNEAARREMNDSDIGLIPLGEAVEGNAPPPPGPALAPSPQSFPPAAVRVAKRIKAIRQSRAGLLDASLLGEPAWNILLALYVAAGERYALTISALSAESGVPATTAARSINRLLQLKMVRRLANPSDNRSSFIELTESAAEKLGKLLEDAEAKHWTG
jgi:DNA-binding MarR family transcriptional regulator